MDLSRKEAKLTEIFWDYAIENMDGRWSLEGSMRWDLGSVEQYGQWL